MRVYQFRHSGSEWAMRRDGLKSDPGRDRTCDPRIKSPLLYQLSYGVSAAEEINVTSRMIGCKVGSLALLFFV